MMQRMPMFAGMQQALAAQGQGQPRAVPPQQPPMWNGMQQNPWLQNKGRMPGQPGQPGGMGMLRAMGQQLGAQAQNWGNPGQGAPTIRNPSAGRSPDAMRAEMTQREAGQYARGREQGLVNDEDPRFNGMR